MRTDELTEAEKAKYAARPDDGMAYAQKVDALVQLCFKYSWDTKTEEFFEQSPTPEQMADVIQALFEIDGEKHILMTIEAIKRGVVKDLRSHPGQLTKLTIAEIWESTAYAQVLRLAGWKCDKDSDPDGKEFITRTQQQ